MDPHEMVPGQRYTVTFEDCCVSGELTGVFKELVNPGYFDHSGDPEEDFDHALFDFGSIDCMSWAITKAEA